MAAVATVTAALSLWLLPLPSTADGAPAAHAAAPYDINGDGYSDLVVADPFATISGNEEAGLVRVALSSPAGLTGNVQVLTQDSPGIKGRVRPGRQFGQGVISADFDADGYADIAGQNYGSIHVVYGGPSGLTGRDQLLPMNRLPTFSLLGPILTSGDFDNDGFADLVVSSPGSEDIKGTMVVLRGTTRGLTTRGAVQLSRNTPGVPGKGFVDDFFGAGLGVGDITGDGVDDLAVTSQEEVGGSSLYVFPGSSRGLQTAGLSYVVANTVFGGYGTWIGNETVLAVADLDGDRFGDLIVGSSNYCIVGDELEGCGAVTVLPGSRTGLVPARAYRWDQDTVGVPGQARSFDGFGATLATGDLDRDGHIDLAVAAPGMKTGRVPDDGAVIIVYGGAGGLNFGRSQAWSQSTRKIKGVPIRGDNFGNAGLRIADVGRGTRPDLIVYTRDERERTRRKAPYLQAFNVLFSGRTASPPATNAGVHHRPTAWF